MSRVRFLRLDDAPETFDPDDSKTMRCEGQAEPVRLRSEDELLSTDPADLEPIPSRPASHVLFRSLEGHWIQHERRASIFPTYPKGNRRHGRKYAQLTLDESAGWFESRGMPLPDILVQDIANSQKPGPDDGPLARDTNSRVADILHAEPRATSKEIGLKIGKSENRVRTTTAWKDHQKKLKEQRHEPGVHTRPLSTPMLAVVASDDRDPAEIAAEREVQKTEEESIELLERKYLEGANAEQKARFFQLSQADKEHELKAWHFTGMREG